MQKNINHKKVNLINLISQNYVVSDAPKKILNKNLERPRNPTISAHSAILALELFYLKIVKLRRFSAAISAILGRGYRASPCKTFCLIFYISFTLLILIKSFLKHKKICIHHTVIQIRVAQGEI